MGTTTRQAQNGDCDVAAVQAHDEALPNGPASDRWRSLGFDVVKTEEDGPKQRNCTRDNCGVLSNCGLDSMQKHSALAMNDMQKDMQRVSLKALKKL